jgi:hypothetical protein
MNRYCIIGLLAACLPCVEAYGQKSDLAPLKQRAEVVAKATELIESRGKSVALPENLINPFVGREPTVTDNNAADAPVSEAEIMEGSDFLARLAAQIPVSGTATLGGDALLLLGQKRLKAGDVVKISFEGKSYELTITHVGTTTFTVSRGDLTHTRPTRLSR